MTNVIKSDIIIDMERGWEYMTETKRPMLSHTNFKVWCKAQGMTAKDVAEKLDINISTVYKYWQGISKPTRTVEAKMIEVFGIDTKSMFDFI